jgi:hypothetical protein
VAEAKIAARWRLFGPECDERRRRVWAASEASTHGPGGVALVARATGISPDTIRRGIAELESSERLERGQVRRSGAGRRPVVEADPSVLEDLDRLVDPVTRGIPSRRCGGRLRVSRSAARRRPDQPDHDQHRTERLRSPGSDHLHQSQGHNRANRGRQHHPPRLAPRMELPDHTGQSLTLTRRPGIDPRALNRVVTRFRPCLTELTGGCSVRPRCPWGRPRRLEAGGRCIGFVYSCAEGASYR